MSQETDSHVAIGCFLLTMVLVIMFYLAVPAHSQEAPAAPQCARAADLIAQLQKQYGETVTAAGVVGNQFMEMTTNQKTQSFTIIMRRPDGVGCIVMGGTGFALADPAPIKGMGL